MLKKPSGVVFAGHCRPTISAAFTGVPCLIRDGVNLKSRSKAADNMIQ